MPRPGPRPYECVRRAWHSDRHQPIRGSLIQQIFRVVNEAHAMATKKNKEWQEKLPIVVLKAEEIMYSKANSETEYTNLETLWDRVNDAINTIIRREETTETGDLLPPCVEAALNLGCVPVRASRSQRHSNPRTYLTPRPQQDHQNPSARVADRTRDEREKHHPKLLPFHPVNNQSPNFARTPNFISENLIAGPKNLCSGSRSAYPLYYGTQFRSDDCYHHSGARVSDSSTIYVGTPVVPPSTAIVEPARSDCFAAMETKCDLSLRLGRSESDDFDTRRSTTNKEFCFFPGNPKPNFAGEGPSSEAMDIIKGKKPSVPLNWFNT